MNAKFITENSKTHNGNHGLLKKQNTEGFVQNLINSMNNMAKGITNFFKKPEEQSLGQNNNKKAPSGASLEKNLSGGPSGPTA